MKSINQTLKTDIEYYKKGKKPPRQPKVDFNSSLLDMSGC